MQCPHCGYLMLAVDKDCARCRQRGFTPSQNAAPPPMPGVPYAPPNTALPQPPPANTPPVWSAAPPPLNGGYAPPPVYPQAPNSPYGSAPAPPYIPTPAPARSAPEPSTASQVIFGILGVLVLVGVIGLRFYLAEQRAARRDAAFLEMNQHYNETMRPQFDNMRNMQQEAQQRAMNFVPPQRPVIINQPAPVTINAQPGLSPAQASLMQAQQDLQLQRMQSQQNMQMQNMQMQQNMQNMHNQNMMQMQNMHDRMMQNRPGFGGRF